VVAHRGRPDLPGCLGEVAPRCRRLFPRSGVVDYWTCAPGSGR
jgi:hypothetical protein